MKMPERKKQVLCTSLDSIKQYAEQIGIAAKLLREKNPKHNPDYLIHVIRGFVKSILSTDKIAKSQALAMEKRLYLYKETIEGLGFVRKRKRYTNPPLYPGGPPEG